jgi:hypothetical protein
MSAPPCAKAGTSRTLAGTRIAEIQITPDAHLVSQRRVRMMIRQIKSDWYRLDADGLVFFGYTRDEVRHKFYAWLRQHDMKALR